MMHRWWIRLCRKKSRAKTKKTMATRTRQRRAATAAAALNLRMKLLKRTQSVGFSQAGREGGREGGGWLVGGGERRRRRLLLLLLLFLLMLERSFSSEDAFLSSFVQQIQGCVGGVNRMGIKFLLLYG